MTINKRTTFFRMVDYRVNMSGELKMSRTSLFCIIVTINKKSKEEINVKQDIDVYERKKWKVIWRWSVVEEITELRYEII